MKDLREINNILIKIKNYLISIYNTGIKHVILYGSYARKNATPDSDIDVLVVVDDSLIPREVEEKLSDLLFDILLEERELVSVIVVKKSMYENYRSPLLLSVKEEGVEI
jgi:predicted nucleotidyltransferase